MYECGDGRVSELLSRWLLKLGLTAKSFVQEMEEVSGEVHISDNRCHHTAQVAEAGPLLGRRLVEAARASYPNSCSVPVITIHLCWDQVTILPSHWSTSTQYCPLIGPHHPKTRL